MHKAAIAEWMLSLAASKESAASITGDLVERKEPWFWVSVIRTVFSFSMQDLAADPRRFTLLALKGFGFLLLWQILFLLVGIIAIVQLFPVDGRDVPLMFYLMADVAASQFLVGRAIAKRAPQYEISAWLALAIAETLLNSAFIIAGSYGWKGIAYSLACFALYQIPAFTGAVLVRRRAARGA